MFSPAAIQPLAQSLPPAVKAGGFLLTLGAVLSAHVLPLAWYLAASSNSVTLQPPVLTGVLLQQPASQQQVAPAVPEPQQQIPPAPATVVPVKPEPERQLPKPVPQLVQAEPPPAAVAEPVLPSASTTAAATRAVTQTETSAAIALPVSAPVLNATAQYNAPPVYPQLSRKLREQGTVVLELTVLKNGAVADVALLHSSGYPRLDQAALAAVQQWRYQAARRGNAAIEYRYRQRVEFSLTEGVN